ncbi:hypothetical protein [Candidatus Leptofilum sp.]|uniref:hypothetical protein n=1 Tax=Candidatus Leptofilum sp. TaxID=3241576 RepID=UPI003B5CF67C
MKISEKDANLFFDLMFPLQLYVNQAKRILSNVASLDDYKARDLQEQAAVRDALWAEPTLITQYVSENPDSLSPEHLEIVDSWRQRVQGRFVMERLLKKHAIFIDGDQVYGVQALHNSFDEMIPKQMLPVFVETVLLPFKEQIIYDGLIRGGNIMIGSNMAAGFKETYMAAKRNGKIITSLEPGALAKLTAKKPKPLKNWQPQLDSLIADAKSLRAEGGSPPTWSPAFSLVKASLAFAKTAVATPQDEDALWKSFERIVRAVNKAEDGIFRT